MWSLFNFVWMNHCCLGLAAFIFSIKAQDRKGEKDLKAARECGTKAFCLSVFALAAALILAVVFIVLLVAGALNLHWNICDTNTDFFFLNIDGMNLLFCCV
ncbi:dispanin subfamily A member 2b-like [Arapaima gigas]